jgi:hypothetical protein
MKIVLTILLLAINSVLSATNYYVKNGGNDSNSGLDDANAWAHHPWMSTWTGSVTLAAGDSVMMHKGDIWTIANPSVAYMSIEQSGTSGHYITTTVYGVGNQPIIKISTNSNYPVIYGAGRDFIRFNNINISHHAATIDATSLKCGIIMGYSGDGVVHDWIITDCYIHSCPAMGISCAVNSYNIIIGDITATGVATSTNYSNQISDCGYAGIMVEGCDPVSLNANSYFYYNYIHDINFGGNSGENAYGISFSSHSISNNGVSKHCYIRYNRIEDIPTWTALDIHNGQYLYFQDNYIYNCHIGVNGQQRDEGIAPILDNIYIERNIIENPTDDIFTDFAFTGIEGLSTNASTNIYIRDNTFFYTIRPIMETGAFAIKIGHVNGATIDGNNFYNGPMGSCQGAIFLDLDIKNANVRNNFIKNWYYAISIKPAAVQGRVDVFNNIISSQGVAISCENTGSFEGDLALYNNTIVSTAASSYYVPLRFDGMTIQRGASIKIKNNILGFTGSHAYSYIITPASINGTLEIDYNLYWNSTKSDPYYLQNVSYNWPDWNAHGYDTHGLNNTDPVFMNRNGSYSTGSDFILQSTSPAVNKGVDINEITHDFFGSSRDATPDIGAYEYFIPDQKVAVTNITVTGVGGSNTVSTYKGTLQLSATVSPSNATNKEVTWSIENATGQATINSGGLFTAITNGTVTARATAIDGSGVYGIFVITISNQVIPTNAPPVVVITYSSSSYSGFVNEIDASGSYDVNNDNLSYTWLVPGNISASSTTGSKIKFLCPILNAPQTVYFTLYLSDGKTTMSKVIPIEILPYKPELEVAEILKVDASGFQSPNYPNNVLDGNIGTLWAANGNNQWLILKLKEVFNIQHVKLSFQLEQRRESYFDILGSEDKVTWEPILSKSSSCAFSGDLQVFEFPPSKTEKEFKYVKFIGLSNSVDSWNYISEFRIYGNKHHNPTSYEEQPVKIYPNPARELINIRIDEPTLKLDFIRIVNLSGKVVFQDKVNPYIYDLSIPINLIQGIYIVQMGSGEVTLFTQKLIVDKNSL